MRSQTDQRPVVSIILTTYNRLGYLRLAVDSIYAQTFKDWELVVADDGSGAETREYLATLSDPPHTRIVWLTHSGNLPVVRNAALREATGTYVAFLDSDDEWAPRKLQRQLEVLRASPHCRWSYTAFTQIDRKGAVLPEERLRKWVPQEGWIFERTLRNQVALRTPSLVLAERELVMQAGAFDEQCSAEDLDLYLRLARRSEIALVDEPLVRVRVHEENHSNIDLARGLVGRDYVLRKVQRSPEGERWQTLLLEERVATAIRLAGTYAMTNSRLNLLRTIRNSLPYGSSHPGWWWGISKAIARVLTPRRVFELRRRWRTRAAAPCTAAGVKRD